jgi:hypothetical protein
MHAFHYLCRDLVLLISIIVTFVAIANGQWRPISPDEAAGWIALLVFCLGVYRGVCQPEPRGDSCSVGCLLSAGLPFLSLLNLIIPASQGLKQFMLVLGAMVAQLLVLAAVLYVFGFGFGSIFAIRKSK